MSFWRSRPSHLLAGAICFFSLASTAGAQGGRLYGMIDIDGGFGDDIAFSIELGGAHTVRYYAWGRDLDEVEGMAVDGDGELYLFAETGVVKKVRLVQPDARPVTVAQGSGFDLTSATSRPSDGLIELFDARGGQLVTFDPAPMRSCASHGGARARTRRSSTASRGPRRGSMARPRGGSAWSSTPARARGANGRARAG